MLARTETENKGRKEEGENEEMSCDASENAEVAVVMHAK
jgi:hypothetical protein